jgi:hypothetical protein
MDEIEWKSNGCCNDRIDYQVWNNGQLIQQNHFSATGGAYRNFGIQGGAGDVFDEVRLVFLRDQTPFAPNQFQAFVMDDLEVHALNPPTSNSIPEPGTWALMLLGFGAIGTAVRRRRSGIAAP